MSEFVPSPSHPIRVLLVDDQAMIGEAVRRMLLIDPTVEYRYCGDPTQAIQVAAEFQPTVILQDLVMPDVDGLMMLKFYRQNPGTRDVPVIVLSTKEEPKTKAEAFSLGANDYLVKLPDPIELAARVRHHSRGYVALMERNAAYVALKLSEERLASELAQAASYITSLLPERLVGDIATDWAFIPSVELGGDAFGYYDIDADHFALYLLDVCGHGVKAALLSISAINVLRNQTLAATDFRSPAAVLAGMNQAFQMERHNDLYFTLWYGVFNRRSRELHYGTAGHPPIILVGGADAATATARPLKAGGLVIGAVPNVTYQPEVMHLPPFSLLYLYSDGVYEITRPDDTMMEFDEFVAVVDQAPRNLTAGLASIITTIRSIRGRPDMEDDVSMVALQL